MSNLSPPDLAGSRAAFSGLLKAAQRYDDFDFVGNDFTSAQADSVVIASCTFGKIIARRAKMRNISLCDVRLNACDWSNADLAGARLVRAEIIDCKLTGTNFSEATFQSVRFSGCKLDGAWFQSARLEQCLFDQCDLSDADLSHAQLGGTVFRASALRRVQLIGSKLREADLRGSDLRDIHAPGADFREAVVDPSQCVDVALTLGVIVRAKGAD